MRTGRKPDLFWAALALGLIFALIHGRAAQAHAAAPTHASPEPGQAYPAAPAEITLVFAEELSEAGCALRLEDAWGNILARGEGLDLDDPNHATLRLRLPALEPGIYTVRWTVTLDDGDESSGQYHFGVGDMVVPDEAQSAASQPQAAQAAAHESAQPVVWAVSGLALLAVLASGAWLLWRRKG